MSNYASLKSAIQQVIKTNGNNEITGALLQQSLLSMINSLGVGYQFVGIATPTTNPGTPDQNVFYLASTAGTYANFGGLVLADGEISLLKYNGEWSKDSTGAASLVTVNQLVQDLHQETDGVVFNGNVAIRGYDNVATVFNMKAGKVYSISLDMVDFSGTAYFSIKDKDGNWLRKSMAVTSMPFTYQYTPQQDYSGAKVILGNGGTNIFSINISVNNSIYERLNAVNEKADNNTLAIGQIANDILRIDSEIEGIQLTGRQLPISYIRTSEHLQYDANTQKIVASDNASRYILYRYFTRDEYVLVGGEISNITKTLYICKTAQVPEANVSATDVIAVNTSTFEKVVKVQAGDYLCMVVNYTYHSNFSMAVLEQSKSLILLNAKNSAPINQYDDKIVDITYNAAYYAQYPGNTYGNFLASIQAGFGGLKADMRLTSDNKIVLCHDSGYKLNSDGDIIPYNSAEYASSVEIHDKTFAEITALKFAEQVGGQDINPCSLDDMLYLCKRYIKQD